MPIGYLQSADLAVTLCFIFTLWWKYVLERGWGGYEVEMR